MSLPVTAANPLTRRIPCAATARAIRAREGIRAIDLAQLDAERREVVVVVLPLLVEVGGAGVEVVLRRGLEPEEHGRVHRAFAGDDPLDGRPQHRPDLGADPAHLGLVHEIGLVQHDEVRAGELLLQQFLERALVVEGVVGLALGLDRGRVCREEPRRVRGGIDDRDHPVHGYPRAHARPAERLHQRLGKGKTRGLDDDVVGRSITVEQGLDGGEEVIRDGAADAAVGKLEDVVLHAVLDAAALDDLRVDAELAELVDDEREATTVGVGEEVADEARLARAEEAGDHGGGGPGRHGQWSLVRWAASARAARAAGAARAAPPPRRAASGGLEDEGDPRGHEHHPFRPPRERLVEPPGMVPEGAGHRVVRDHAEPTSLATRTTGASGAASDSKREPASRSMSLPACMALPSHTVRQSTSTPGPVPGLCAELSREVEGRLHGDPAVPAPGAMPGDSARPSPRRSPPRWRCRPPPARRTATPRTRSSRKRAPPSTRVRARQGVGRHPAGSGHHDGREPRPGMAGTRHRS